MERCTDQPRRPVILWSTPRSASTAFARAMMHNARVDVVREPFANCYYFGRDRRSMRYGNRPAVAHIDQSAVFARVLRSRRGKTCFVKELAFQGRPYVTDAFLGVARHLFLINTPEVVYSALVKLKPDFNEDEFGFSAILELYERVSSLSDASPWLFTTHDFWSRPGSVLRDVCRLMRVPFEESMLQSHPCRMKGDQVREPESRQSSRASAEKRRGVARYGELIPG